MRNRPMLHRPLLAASTLLVALLAARSAAAPTAALFATSHECMACHNGLTSAAGEDVSFGFNWRPSMMANAARDPYWQATVRRESIDHPQARAEIEDECSACHMPMVRYQAKLGGRKGKLFAHLPVGRAQGATALLAADGVSCAICHQLGAKDLGAKHTFTGNFFVDTSGAPGRRKIFGPHAVDGGRQRIMRSAAGFEPAEAKHIQRAEVCASCHTLYTHARGAGGKVIGTFPEQVPFLEWQHSAYRDQRSCQDCHMPALQQPARVSSVHGQPRPALSQHVFRGGNFLMPRIFARYAAERGVQALPQELDAAAKRAAEHLRTSTASLRIEGPRPEGNALAVDVVLTNLAGHKLPTAYPSRRAWLHVTARDEDGEVLFESGALTPQGRILGNDNDDDPLRFEPHHAEIRSGDDVQIYESIMVDYRGRVTTGLLSGARYAKDNRVLPRGFDKRRAHADVAVRGAAARDADFTAGGDRVRYRLPVAGSSPLRIEVELLYQPIGFRWAENFAAVRAAEPARFIRYFRALAPASAVVVARAAATWTPPEAPEQPAPEAALPQ